MVIDSPVCHFFLQLFKAKNDSRSLFYVQLTLDKMADGGIYDHLGGGFSRYCVDEKWFIPHFEKMLYDNALLIGAYLQTWKLTKEPRFRKVVEESIEYVLREMTDTSGGFYSAQDADYEGQEGGYYTWKMQEIEEAIGSEDSALFCRYFGCLPEGNFEGKNILHIPFRAKEFSEAFAIALEDLQSKIHKDCQILLKKRLERKAPFKDDKIICSANGLMIDAMAKAGAALQNPKYLLAAVKAATFLKDSLWKEGHLQRRFRDGESKYRANLDDYAFLLKAVITLFEVEGKIEWLQWGIELAQVLEKEFKSLEGAFFQVDEKSSLLIRKCEFYDGAEPSGNAVHAENLLRLYQLTLQEKFLRQAEDILKAAKGYIENFPPGASYHLISLQRYLDNKAPLVVVALNEKNALETELREKLFSLFCPHLAVIWRRAGDEQLQMLAPAIAKQTCLDGQTTVYICRHEVCQPPLVEKAKIFEALETL